APGSLRGRATDRVRRQRAFAKGQREVIVVRGGLGPFRLNFDRVARGGAYDQLLTLSAAVADRQHLVAGFVVELEGDRIAAARLNGVVGKHRTVSSGYEFLLKFLSHPPPRAARAIPLSLAGCRESEHRTRRARS